MSWLAGPYLTAAVLLMVAGGPKVARPQSAVRALASLRWPASPLLVRVLGAAEVLCGSAAVLTGGRAPALLVAGSYAGFTGFVALARIRGGVLASCGCFGQADVPPTRTHMALTATLGLVALAIAVRPVDTLAEVLRTAPGDGAALLGLVTLGTWLAYLVLAVLPRASGRAIARAGARATARASTGRA